MIFNTNHILVTVLTYAESTQAWGRGTSAKTLRLTTMRDSPGKAEVNACLAGVNALTWGMPSSSSSSSSSYYGSGYGSSGSSSSSSSNSSSSGSSSGSSYYGSSGFSSSDSSSNSTSFDSTSSESLSSDTSSSAEASSSSGSSWYSSYYSGSSSYSKSRYSQVSYDIVCGYPPASGTFALCVYESSHNRSRTLKAASKILATYCKASTSYSYDWDYFYSDEFANATASYVPLNQLDTSESLYVNTLPNMTSVKETYISDKTSYFGYDSGTWFSVAFYGYFLFLFFCASIYNFFRLSGVSIFVNNLKFAKLCQRFVILPSLLPRGKYSQYYGWKFLSILPPNRIQFLVDLVFFGLEVAFYCVPYYGSSDDREWNQWVGYRSGIMAFGKIPLLILFAGRNNAMLWLTGCSYATFLHYHKIVALYMFVDCLIHSVSYTIGALGTYVRSLQSLYFVSGVVATTICGIILIQSFHVFRTFGYEYFLILHIALVIVFIATCWWHCNGLGWMEWMIASCAVWFFDRLLRVIRMSACGYRKSTITAIAGDLLKVEVPKPIWWIQTPGTYAYIYFLNLTFWENHPFTVVCEDDKICAYIRVKKGVTKRLWKNLAKHDGKMTCRVCLEGPYGGQLSLMHKRYDETIFVAGGSGVPGILEGAVHASKGKFIWVSQTMELVIAYYPLLSKVTIPIDIYVTRENDEDRKCSKKELLAGVMAANDSSSETESQTDSTDGSDKEVSDKEVAIIEDQITILYGRPKIQEIIENEIQGSPYKSICVSACGPPILMDELTNTIADNVTRWDKSIDFFDEFQLW